jgi:hypothetical protein
MAGKRSADLSGMTFGLWTVLTRAPGTRRAMWHCRCACGAKGIVGASPLVNGKSTQCKPCGARMQARKNADLAGETFGRWSVIERAPSVRRAVMWRCRCACGIEMPMRVSRLISGKSTQCRNCAQGERQLKARRSVPAAERAAKLQAKWERMRELAREYYWRKRTVLPCGECVEVDLADA